MNTEYLAESEDGKHLEYNGEVVAKLHTNSRGWNKFYITPKGDGFGTIRNTGFEYYRSLEEYERTLLLKH